MLTHCAAFHRPTTVQQTQSIVAARVVAATVPWDVADWRNWCASSKRAILVHNVKKLTKKKGLESLSLRCSEKKKGWKKVAHQNVRPRNRRSKST